ncbi:MAG TPA: AsmA family protein [Anaeromyxobacter sp.]
MSTPRSLGRKVLVALAAVVALVVLLVAVLLAIVNSGVATKRAVDLVLPSVSKALGREVTLAGAKLKLFPNAHVALAGLTVAGRPGEPALVEAEALDVEVALWPLLRSLGKDVEVSAFTLVKPSVNLVKAKDGTWNFEGLGGEPGAKGRSAEAARPGAAEGGGARVAVSLVKIAGAAIRVVDRSGGKEGTALALTHLDLEARGVGPGLPLDARLAAAFADLKQNVHAQLSVAELPAGVPKRPEDWPQVQGSVQVGPLALDRIHALLPGDVGAIVRGGVASLEAKLSTTGTHGYRVDGAGELKDVRLRGQASSGRFRAAASWSPAKPAAARLDLTDLALRGPGIDLGGNLSVETAPVRAWFVLTGPLLDLDAVMGILPEASAPSQAAPGAPAGDLVPEGTRREIHGAAAHGTIAIEKLKGGRVEATDVRARATLSRGTLTLDELTAAVFGGRVSAAGTKVALSEKVPSWTLAADLSGLDLEKTLTAFEGRSPLLGKLDGRLEIDGKGTEWEKLRDGLTGLAALAVKEGALTTTDLGDSVLGGLAKGLDVAGKGGAAKKVGGAAGGKTTFRDLAGKFTVKGGALTAQSPVQFGSSAGEVALGGKIGLDGRLGLEGKAIVPKKTLAEVVSGIALPDKLEVPLAIGGTLTSPSVSVRADQAVASLVKGEAKRAVEDLRGKAEKEGKKAAEGLFKRFGGK